VAEPAKGKRRKLVGDKRREPAKDKMKPGPVEDKGKEKEETGG